MEKIPKKKPSRRDKQLKTNKKKNPFLGIRGRKQKRIKW